MATSKIPRNALCPCGNGKKYKKCCYGKEFDWVATDDGRITRTVPVSEELGDVLDSVKRAFEARHGRKHLPGEPLFADAPPMELIEHHTVEAMKQAGIDAAIIHAFQQTGLMMSDANEAKCPDADIAEWEAAIDAYERETDTKATKRRITQEDFMAILAAGPK